LYGISAGVGLMIVLGGIVTSIHEREEAAKSPAQRNQEAAEAEKGRLASRNLDRSPWMKQSS
jgi:hypothetical protein